MSDCVKLAGGADNNTWAFVTTSPQTALQTHSGKVSGRLTRRDDWAMKIASLQ